MVVSGGKVDDTVVQGGWDFLAAGGCVPGSGCVRRVGEVAGDFLFRSGVGGGALVFGVGGGESC